MTLTEDMTAPDTDQTTDDGVETDSGMRQFVSFYLGRECFAFPIGLVKEIIRVPSTIAVPMTPPALIGLANLRGAVLPVLDFRLALGLETGDRQETSRVVVINTGHSVGLLVDRVAQVINVPQDRVEPANVVDRTVQSDVLTGVVKEFAGEDLIQLLDPEQVIAGQFPDTDSLSQTAMTQAMKAAEASAKTQEDDDTVQLVSIVIGDEEYAFPIEEVDEIVRVPQRISAVPGSDPHVLGLVNLRQRLLPLACLRMIFDLPQVERTDANRVVVLNLGQENGEELRVGLVVDHVREVLRVSAATQDRMPGVLRRGDQDEISAICRLEGGKRLVSVLSGPVLFETHGLHEAVRLAAEQAGDHLDREHDEEEREMTQHVEADETQLVVYQLAAQEFGVAIHSVQEIIRVPDSLSRVPNTPDTVEGIINLRGSVLPVVEMRRRFGLPAIERNDRQRILVLNVDGVRTGYIVDSVSEVLRVPATAMEDTPSLSQESDTLMGRVANLSDGKRLVLVLDASALVEVDALDESLTGTPGHAPADAAQLALA